MYIIGKFHGLLPTKCTLEPALININQLPPDNAVPTKLRFTLSVVTLIIRLRTYDLNEIQPYKII